MFPPEATFAEKPQLKTIKLKKKYNWNLIHTGSDSSDKGVKG